MSRSIIHGNIELDPELRRVIKGGKKIILTQKEFALLEYLLENKEKVCCKKLIAEKISDLHFDYDTSVIDVYINFLRKKLDDPGHPSIIETIIGIGYKIGEL
jgi:two-component system, OmpR family, copper resistance phosphate regulon response regulator CusR